MTEFPPQYRDYITRQVISPPSGKPAPQGVEESAVVMKLRDGRWYAIVQRAGAESAVDEFLGSRDDAVEWARQRSRECWVYSEALGDVVRLDEEHK